MSCMNFDHSLLVNLEQSLQKEFLRSNRAGAFASSTLIYCNTRKHHGLLICPIDNESREHHVLLSSLDETVVQEGQAFHLGIHKYPNSYSPLGHKYIEKLGAAPTPYVIYRIGGTLLKKETILVEEQDQILFKYTVEESTLPLTLRLQPYLAFRNIHAITRENFGANTRYEDVEKGVRLKLYEPYPYLYLQSSKNCDFVPVPSWYYNVEYLEDQKAGEQSQEDLYVPGYFEIELKKGETIILSASTEEIKPTTLQRKFTSEIKKRLPRTDYHSCLINAAEQFIRKRNGRTDIIAGYPTFGASARDAFLALSGLTLHRDGDEQNFFAVIDTLLEDMLEGDLFERLGNYKDKRAADTPLLFFWALQEYVKYKGSYAGIWKKYGSFMKQILNVYAKGEDQYIKMHENGLIHADQPGMPLTWMDVVVDDEVITRRPGYTVEVNAFWYNAIMFAIEVSQKARVKKFKEEWEPIAEKVKESFVEVFWSAEHGYLADYVSDEPDWSIRPNMIFAASLPYSPLSDDLKADVLDTVYANLLAKKGIRSLSPRDYRYVGLPSDDRKDARKVYHQGNIFPWLFGHFIDGLLVLKGRIALPIAKQFYDEFEKEMTRKGLGAISEYFHGNPPHEGRGAISQAWNTAELLRIRSMIEQHDA